MKIMSIVIWDFSAVSGKINRFYLNHLELTSTFPCLHPVKGRITHDRADSRTNHYKLDYKQSLSLMSV